MDMNAVSTYAGSVALASVAGKQPDNTQYDNNGGAQPETTAQASAMSQQQSVDPRQETAGNKGDTKTAETQSADGKAFFAVDDDKNVVIKVTDSAGKVVRQIPAEDYLKMVKVLDENAKSLLQSNIGNNLYHKEA
ncbi:MAG: flagellar protein FlaG [Nitrospirota bacterium]